MIILMLRGTAGTIVPGYLTKFSDILVDLPGYTNWYTVFCSTQYPVPSRGDTKFSTTSRANLKFSTTAVPVELLVLLVRPCTRVCTPAYSPVPLVSRIKILVY